MPWSVRRSDRFVRTPSASAPPRPTTTMACAGSRRSSPAIHRLRRLASGVYADTRKTRRPAAPSSRIAPTVRRPQRRSGARGPPARRSRLLEEKVAGLDVDEGASGIERDTQGIAPRAHHLDLIAEPP